jgi:hypothetical protein
MKKVSLLLLALAMSAAGSRMSYAAPEPPQITPVSWIVATQHNSDLDDKVVILVGRVIRPAQGGDWWFSDTTGSVRLETGDMELPVGPLLRVRARIDQATWGIGVLEVKVKHWQYAGQPGQVR